MTKKMKRERTPTPVEDNVVEAMEARAAEQPLSAFFAGLHKAAEDHGDAHDNSAPHDDKQDGNNHSGN